MDSENTPTSSDMLLEDFPLKEPSKRRRYTISWTGLIVGLLVGSWTILTISLTMLLSSNCSPRQAWNMFNAESVLSSRLDAPGHIVTLQGDLEQENDIWAQPPSPEIDAAWLAVTNYGNAWATADDLLRAGKNLSVSVKFSPEAGLGDDAYPIISDVKHLIHCLNRIRKDLYFDYYWKSTFPSGVPSKLHQRHTAHCFSILVQSLVCNANTDFITYAWYDGYALPLHDFNIDRKCGDFAGISDWMKDHVVQQDDVFDYTRKASDQATLPMSPSLRAVVEGYDGEAEANAG